MPYYIYQSLKSVCRVTCKIRQNKQNPDEQGTNRYKKNKFEGQFSHFIILVLPIRKGKYLFKIKMKGISILTDKML